MKRKLLLAALCVVGALGMRAADLPTSGSGEFFIKNVGTGTYLKGDAYYGTKAVVWNDPYAVTLTYVSEGVYTIQSQQNNGGNSQYFGSGEDLYVDQSVSNMTFTEVDATNHYYTIANSAGNLYAVSQLEDGATIYKVMAGNVTTDYAKWQIVSRAELEAALNDASNSNPVDATFFIKDAGIDAKSVNANSWSTTNVALAGGGNAGHSAESWNSANFNMSQTVTGLPNGKYKATCYGYYRWNNGGNNDNAAAVSGHASGDEVLNAVFFAGTKETPLMSVAGDADATTFCQTMTWDNNTPNSQWQAAACFTQGFYLNTIEDIVVTDGTLTIGVKKTTQAGTDWAVFDEFKLYYLGEDLSIYVNAYSEALAAAQAVDQDAPMLGTALTALKSALTAYGSVDETDKEALQTAVSALNTATTNATTSIAAYAVAKTAIDAANALKDAHNFATVEATTTFTNAIKAISDKYDDSTLTDEEATNAATTLGIAVTGWHANPNGAAVNYMESGFGLNDFDAALYINTWSTEGDNDGTGFSVPFFEYWVGNGTLAEKTWTGTLTDLPNGQYKVTAWVRVSGGADATGITMDVNNGDAVDVTEGDIVNNFNIKTYEAIGLVKNGTLSLNVNVAANNTTSWLSFKNVKYTKVRDLTPEEMAVAPTAIALYNGETEVTAPIALDATTPSVTLTPSYTPANATEGYLTWTTSDATVATVANGVVTGVSSGTATITATSTLDATVSATATVTVTYPETEVAEYTNDGATRYVHNYGENLIKNGSFQYPNSFQGWKSGANGNCDANNFNIVTDGDNKYIQATQSQGAGNSHSISTGWAIEAGKTYIFGYKVKASKTGTMEYLVTSLTNTIGTEEAKLDKDEDRKAKPVTTSWTDVKYEFTNSDNYAYVQFRARWMADSQSFDDFYLVEKMADDDVIGNVDYATAAIPTANIGTGAFQYSQDAIDAANALVQGTATVEDVEAAYDALTTLNVPTAEQVFNIVMGDLTWTNNNNATMLSTQGKAVTYYAGGRSDGGGYTSQFDKEPNTNLAQAFYFTPAEGKNKYTIYQIDADGKERYICTGTVYGGNANQVRTTTEADKAEVFTITATTSEGVYNFTNASNINLGAQDAGLYGTNRNNNLKIVETTKPSITINTTAAGWGTIMLPFAVGEIPTGVKVYTCADVSGNELTIESVTALEANKPYIIEGAWEANLTGDAQGAALTYTEGLLTGVYTGTNIKSADNYVLQKINNKVAFYQVDPNDPITVPANRAYLTYSKSEAPVRALFFPEDSEATAIDGLDVLTSGDYDAIYTANGVQVKSLQKGLNVVKKGNKTFKIVVK